MGNIEFTLNLGGEGSGFLDKEMYTDEFVNAWVYSLLNMTGSLSVIKKKAEKKT